MKFKKLFVHIGSKDFLVRLVLALLAVYLLCLIWSRFHKTFLEKPKYKGFRAVKGTRVSDIMYQK